jgi:hypothetical protein
VLTLHFACSCTNDWTAKNTLVKWLYHCHTVTCFEQNYHDTVLFAD